MRSEAVSGRSGDYSDNLRAVGTPRIDDRRSRRETGLGRKQAVAQSAPPSPRRDGTPVAVHEAGGHEAEELGYNGPVGAGLRSCPERRFGDVNRHGTGPVFSPKLAYAMLNIAAGEEAPVPPSAPKLRAPMSEHRTWAA